MNEVPKTYPQELSDSEILEIIETNSENIRKYSRSSNVSLGTSYYHTIIDLGYQELSKRNQAKFLKQVERLNDENEKSGKISFRLNIITIILAVLSIFLSIVTLFYRDDSELNELKKMNKKLNEKIIINNSAIR
ncbi:hypothetical protein [Flavobacterium sp. LM4]|uniref:hypothetical protein n=1 Tax=Flavobacterium sp. LM4 TaxID=1938609 RepID=UPI0009935665|nr:hypothetical protein [Flavobacterium sp. LM4]OOV18598.1 hypothetical protein BXU10_02530 [Flavobacterium sp. LM4]